jgi:hypothetical protein
MPGSFRSSNRAYARAYRLAWRAVKRAGLSGGPVANGLIEAISKPSRARDAKGRTICIDCGVPKEDEQFPKRYDGANRHTSVRKTRCKTCCRRREKRLGTRNNGRSYQDKSPKGFLTEKLRVRITGVLRRRGVKFRGSMRWLPYTAEELVAHIERNFEPGMTWENRDLWHVDHNIPIDWLEFGSPTDVGFQVAFSLRNLRPRWADYNWRKNSKWADRLTPIVESEIEFAHLDANSANAS